MLIKVKNVRASYLKIRQPAPNQSGVLQYDGNFICNDDTTVSLDGGKTFQPLKEGMTKAITQTMTNKFGKVPAKMENWAFCKADGSGTRGAMTDDEGNYKQGYGPDAYYFHANKKADKATQGILVVDQKRRPMMPEDPRYPVSGDYVNVNLFLYAYEANNKKGLTAFLDAVQLYRTGEPFGAAAPTPDAFDEEEEEIEEADGDECF